ncbi:MAG: Hemerythrin cation binding region [Proteobacteria bacterium]|nr:Hemerythrin cation binding region [Pseudomonadota bacterium]
MNTNLMLGVPDIDHQHSELFRSFEHLISADMSEDVISDILSRLTLQICSHFAAEERFMASLMLPDSMLHDHHQAHQKIVEDLTQIHLDTMCGQETPVEKMISKVAHSVSNHLVVYDLELKAYIQ